MPSLPDTAVIVLLGLLLFGPKGLAQIARQLGKLMGEFRRASNEFRMQMEEELRIAEQADRQKQIAAVEAAAPVAPSPVYPPADDYTHSTVVANAEVANAENEAPLEPLPIATSGEMSIMPPATGLPAPRSSSLAALIDSVPRGDPHDPPGTHISGDTAGEEQRPMRYTNHISEQPRDAAAEETLHG